MKLRVTVQHAWNHNLSTPGAWALGATVLILAVAPTASAVQINEIRIDQPSTDNSEYFELLGGHGESLDDLTYLVLGDPGTGRIEAALPLAGQSIGPSGYFLVAEATFENGPGDVFEGIAPDVITSLNFEHGDNVTHLLVADFVGANGDDLDNDDDGQLDSTPWTSIVDGVGFVKELNPGTGEPPLSTEYDYASELGLEALGPDGGSSPGHLYRLPDGGPFTIGGLAIGTDDTPGSSNGGNQPLVGDMDCDGDVDFDDIDAFVLALRRPEEYTAMYGVPPALKGDTDGNGEHTFDDIPGFVDLFIGGVNLHTVPEPSTFGLLGLTGLLGMFSSRWLRGMLRFR